MKRAFYSATAMSALLVGGLSTPVFAASDAQDTVISDTGKIVISKHGACVRSKWMAAGDECAPAKEPEEPVKKAVEQLVPPSAQPDRDQRTVYFDFNKSNLTLEGAQKIDALVTWLAGAKGVTGATVIGFADQIGNVNYNQKLSEKRANAVQSYLKNKGVTIPTDVEVVKGMGEATPVTQCDERLPRTERIVCLAADRRVEIQFDIVR